MQCETTKIDIYVCRRMWRFWSDQFTTSFFLSVYDFDDRYTQGNNKDIDCFTNVGLCKHVIGDKQYAVRMTKCQTSRTHVITLVTIPKTTIITMNKHVNHCVLLVYTLSFVDIPDEPTNNPRSNVTHVFMFMPSGSCQVTRQLDRYSLALLTSSRHTWSLCPVGTLCISMNSLACWFLLLAN